MKIGVELIHISEGATGGLVPLLRGVLETLFAGWPQHEVVLFYRADNVPLFRQPLPPQVHAVSLPPKLYVPLLDVYASQLRLDVLLRTYPSEEEMTFPLERQVVLIPDLQHEFLPEFFTPEVLRGRRAGFSRVLRGAGAIATLSEHARQTILDHQAADPAADRCTDVFLVPPALTAGSATPEDADDLSGAEHELLPRCDYFLYPANLWPHKNHRRVLEAFARFVGSAGRPFEFVFTGHPEGWAELAGDFPGLPVRHLGFVRRGLLRALLNRARALIFFSLFEGFGMPLLEAFAAGVPVACSRCTSLPEVGGDAVLLADPTDVGAMSDAMARLAADEDLRHRLAARGRQRLGRYDWNASASELVAGCARVIARASASAAPAPFPPVHRLNRLLEEIEKDREARLEAIHRLDQEGAARLEAIHRLEQEGAARLEAIHRLEQEGAARLEAIHRGAAERQTLLAALEQSRGEGEALRADGEALRAEVERHRNHVCHRVARKVRGVARSVFPEADSDAQEGVRRRAA